MVSDTNELITSLFAGWKYGILIGAIATLAISLILPILFYVVFLPYKRMKKEIAGVFLFDEPVRFTVKRGTVGGFLVITEKRMVFLSGEADEKSLELSREQVRLISVLWDLKLPFTSITKVRRITP